MEDVGLPEKIKQLRDRADLSMSQMAKVLGLRGASSYQRYEDPVLFKKKYLAFEKVELLIPALVGRGHPPISIDEVRALAAPPARDPMAAFVSLLSPEQLEALRKAIDQKS